MTLTRDQLRAARMLLHLQQDELAQLSAVGVATIRRFETGSAIRPEKAASLRKALEAAGAIFFDGGELPDVPIGVGVALEPVATLSPSTRARIEAAEAREVARLEADRLRREAQRNAPVPDRPPGRPRKTKTGVHEGG